MKEVLRFRVSNREKNLIIEIAKHCKFKSISAWLREAALNYIPVRRYRGRSSKRCKK
jgi:hypothetical protein